MRKARCRANGNRPKQIASSEDATCKPHSSNLLYLFKSIEAHGDSDECLEWPRGRFHDQYGAIKLAGKTCHVHRVAFSIYKGNPGNQKILHTCDNPPCYNLKHLFKGTPKKNSEDMVRKGRQSRGEKNNLSKLTEEQVREIRRLYKHGIWRSGAKAIARRFGVDRHTVTAIARGSTWSHL
jgi:hypothetical protein